MRRGLLIAILLPVLSLAYGASAEVLKNTQFRAAIWVDPDGCQHWVIDTGVEGYMSQRLDRKGMPVCNKPNHEGVYVTGPDGLAVVEPRP